MFHEKEHFEIPDKVVHRALMGLGGALVVALLVWVTPWSDLQAAEVTEPKSTEEQIVKELSDIKKALISIQQKDTSIKNVHEYLLTEDLVGTKKFTIDANTCANGVRVIVRLRNEFRGQPLAQSGSVSIQGVSAAKGRSVYEAQIIVDDVIPAKMRNLPSNMILDDETVFIDYQIVPSENSDRVEYKVDCY